MGERAILADGDGAGAVHRRGGSPGVVGEHQRRGDRTRPARRSRMHRRAPRAVFGKAQGCVRALGAAAQSGGKRLRGNRETVVGFGAHSHGGRTTRRRPRWTRGWGRGSGWSGGPGALTRLRTTGGARFGGRRGRGPRRSWWIRRSRW